MRLTALLALALVGACAGGRSRAQTAIAAAEEALAPIAPEARRVVPDQLKPLTDAVAVAKDKMGRGEYDSALALVQDVPARTDSLAQIIVREKAVITEEMNMLNVAMPRNLRLGADHLSGRGGRVAPYHGRLHDGPAERRGEPGHRAQAAGVTRDGGGGTRGGRASLD